MRRAALFLVVASGCAAAPPTVRSDVVDLYPGAFVELALLRREVLDACSPARDCARPELETRLDLSLSVHDGRAIGVEVAPTSTDDDGFRRCATEVVSHHRFPAAAPDRVPLTIVARWPELGVEPADADGARVACTIAAHHRVLARCTGDHETRGEIALLIELTGDGRALLRSATPEVSRGLQATAERYAACVTEALSGVMLPRFARGGALDRALADWSLISAPIGSSAVHRWTATWPWIRRRDRTTVGQSTHLEAPLAPRRPAPLGLSLDPARPEPLYQQLFDGIVDRIKSGAFPVGFRLPPTRVLAAELDAHRNTVVRAYTRLEQAGFVGSTVGRGTFVQAVPTPKKAALAPEVESSMRWSSLLTERVRAEPFDRLRRITRAAAPSEHVNLTRLQPAPELIPIELFQRCLDHVLRTQGSRALGYTPHEGVAVLREAVAVDLSRRGVPARAEDVVITSGSQQALDVIARGLLEPGDGALLDEATYTGALQIFTAAGARAEPIQADADGPIPSLVDGAASARRAKLLYLMPGHANPTGRRIGEARRRELLAISRVRGLPIVEDDYAADLELEPEPPVPAMRALDGDVLHIGTYSKKLMPALRIGYLLCPPALREPLVALKHATALGTSSLLQHALAEFLERGYLEPHLSRIQAAYRLRRDALVDGLNAHLPAALRVEAPPRGVTVWVPLPDALGVDAVFDETRRHGVLVSPGSMYRVGEGARGVRLTYCWESEERLREGGKRVGQAITALLRAKKGVRSLEGSSIGLV